MRAICWSVLLSCGLGMPYAASSGENLPEEVTMIIEAGDREIAAIRKKAEEDVRKVSDTRLAQLEQLQDKFTKAGKLELAVAVRDKIRELKLGTAPGGDPGNLEQFGGHVGQAFYFELTGATEGRIYGPDVYTADSPLATAAVHSGALDYAEKGIVKVTILPGKSSYEASDRNGVSSREWTSYGLSYKVESTKPTKTEKPAKK